MFISSLSSTAVGAAALFSFVPMAGDDADKILQVVVIVLTIVQLFFGGG